MPSDIKIQAARDDQSAAAKRSTLQQLRSKRRRTKELTIKVNDEEMTLVFQALSQAELDKLRSKHQPTTAQRAAGMGVNTETFAPALVAKCLRDPAMTEDEARELWDSDEWSTGELNQLFDTASQLCLEGMDIPFSDSV